MTVNQRPKIVIAGRPNVGKSTLFNYLTGKNAAIVDATPGVTRDSRVLNASLGDIQFDLVDTAGIEMGEAGLAGELNTLAQDAVSYADIILFLLDGRDGVMPADEALAQTLRSFDKPVVVVVNKSDVGTAEDTLYQTYGLGFENPILISCAHSRGMGELGEKLLAEMEKLNFERSEQNDEEEKPLPLAIVGRPNAGKSTLVNALLKQERMLAGPVAGLTRESIATMWDVDGHKIELVDTPGMRKKAKVVEGLEQMSVGSALIAIARCEAAILVLDANMPFENQDVAVAERVVDEGKPLVIALNKWDEVEDKDECLKDLEYRLHHKFSQVRGIPVIPISALKGKNLEKLLPAVINLHEKWSTRLGTALLNRFLEGTTEANPPPMRKNRRVKLKFMSQVATCPPSFAIFSNMPNDVPDSYIRFLLNGMREAFDLDGIVIRVFMRGGENPYAGRKRKSKDG